jgi:outer membrane biosynthesis protein TonB
MSIRSRRLLLLSSSALVLLCFAGIASPQTTETPPETPPAATTTPQTPPTATPAPETPAPQPSQPAPETPKAEPGIPPAVQVPQVTVEAPKPRSARRTAPAAPARTTAPAPPPPAPPPTTTPPTSPSATTTAGQPAAPSPFQGRLLGRNWFNCYRYFVRDILAWHMHKEQKKAPDVPGLPVA